MDKETNGGEDQIMASDLPERPLVDGPDGKKRERGIFTHSDREAIVGDREYNTRQRRSQVRSRQVQRITDALADFRLLLRLDDLTKRRVFEDVPDTLVDQTLRAIVRFYYQTGMGSDEERLENVVESAVSTSELWSGNERLKSVNVGISIERAPDPKTALEMYKNGEKHELTFEQIGVLVREGLLEEGELAELNWPDGLRYVPPELDDDSNVP